MIPVGAWFLPVSLIGADLAIISLFNIQAVCGKYKLVGIVYLRDLLLLAW